MSEGLRLSNKLDLWRIPLTKFFTMLAFMSFFSSMLEVLRWGSHGRSVNLFCSQSSCSIALNFLTNALLHYSLNQP